MASKNGSRSSQSIGYAAEQATKKYFTQLGYKFISERKKLKHGEVDLIFQKGLIVFFIEVKSLHNSWMSFERITKKQIHNLKMNCLYYQIQNRQLQFKPMLCWVSRDSQIEMIDLNEE